VSPSPDPATRRGAVLPRAGYATHASTPAGITHGVKLTPSPGATFAAGMPEMPLRSAASRPPADRDVGCSSWPVGLASGGLTKITDEFLRAVDRFLVNVTRQTAWPVSTMPGPARQRVGQRSPSSRRWTAAAICSGRTSGRAAPGYRPPCDVRHHREGGARASPIDVHGVRTARASPLTRHAYVMFARHYWL